MGDKRRGRVDCDALLAKLDELWREAGRPFYPEMVRLAKSMIDEGGPEEWRSLSTSTLSNVMNGKFTRLPAWPLIRTIVTVLYKHGTLHGRMDASPQTISTLTREFAEVWDAIETRYAPAGPAAPPYVPGDILEPEVRLAPPRPAAVRMPRAWGRIGAAILRRAEQGDAVAAYRAAVLLACEATREEVTPAYRRQLLDAADEWKKRATGSVTEAMTLQLWGAGLLRAAQDLAFRRGLRAQTAMIFIQAFLHVEHTMQTENADGERQIRSIGG